MKTKMKLITALKRWVVVYPSITLPLYLLGESPLVLPLTPTHVVEGNTITCNKESG